MAASARRFVKRRQTCSSRQSDSANTSKLSTLSPQNRHYMRKQQQPTFLHVVQRRSKTLGASVSSVCIAARHEQQQLWSPVSYVPARTVEPQKQLAHLMIKQRLRNFTPMLWGCHYVDCNKEHAGQDPGYPSHVGVDDEHACRTRTTHPLSTTNS